MDKARYPGDKSQKKNKPKSNFENLAMSFQSSFSHSGLQSGGNLPGQGKDAHEEIEFLKKSEQSAAPSQGRQNVASRSVPRRHPGASMPPTVDPQRHPGASMPPTVDPQKQPGASMPPTMNIAQAPAKAPMQPTINIPRCRPRTDRPAPMNAQGSQAHVRKVQTAAPKMQATMNIQKNPRHALKTLDMPQTNDLLQRPVSDSGQATITYDANQTIAADDSVSPHSQEKTIVDGLDFLAGTETQCDDTGDLMKPAETRKDPFFLIGTMLKDKYQIGKFIGQGGMGAVYLGKHKALGKDRAIKTLIKTANADPTLVKRFFNEARAAASVEHPNVVQVHDIDETDKFYFIVMEYVKGESLEELIRRKNALPVKEAARLIGDSAQGLVAIHDGGLVHRDIKPANLLLNEKGNVKITDFGIVKEIGGDTQLTGSTIIGTPQFMAPEQITKSGIDCRTDIYALGATFYYLATGQHCFTGTAMQLIYQIVQAEPIPPCELDPKIGRHASDVIMKMIAKNSDHRYRNMAEVCEDLASI